MKKTWSFLAVVLAIPLLAPSFSLAQDAVAPAVEPQPPSHAVRAVAIGLMRAINTAEYNHKFAVDHSFVSWDMLAKDAFTVKAIREAVKNDPSLASAPLSEGEEMLPGWKIRLNVTPDWRQYDVMLQYGADKSCGYAVVSNESGIIRQALVIDCQI